MSDAGPIMQVSFERLINTRDATSSDAISIADDLGTVIKSEKGNRCEMAA